MSPGLLEDTVLAPDVPAPDVPGVGDLLGPWRLVRVLQHGGMGVVYLGQRADSSFEQQVAIKLIRPLHLQTDLDLAARLIAGFEEERKLLARMQHPNIARIIDGGSTASGLPWLAMEYVDGVALGDYCRQHVLDVRARLLLFAKVCDGVQEAHRHLVVHRDLKPDNVLVDSDGEPRLLDFGIAKLLVPGRASEAGEAEVLTAMTPAYASPEQVRQQALTTSSDVYSLGVVLYQLLAGVRPYELGGLKPAEIEHVVCERLPEPMRRSLRVAALEPGERKRRAAQIGADLERIVARAMEKDPRRRYGSAQALAEDIRRYLAGEPVQAHPGSALYRARRFFGRHRVASVAAGLALLAVLGASAVALQQAEQARQAAADVQEVNRFLLDILASSDPFDAGRELSLAEAVDRAAGQIDTRFAGRPQIAAGIRHSLGYSMVSRNRLAPAEPLLLQALAESEAATGARSLLSLQIREGLAQLRISQGRMNEADQLLRAVVADMEAAGLQSTEFFHITLNNLGVLKLQQEDYGEAQHWLQRAEQVAPAATGSEALAARGNLLANLAQAAHGLEQLEQASALYAEAQQLLVQAHPQGSPDAAILLNNRAMLAYDQGAGEAAFELWRQSAEMREQVFSGDHPMVLRALTDLARQALVTGRNALALETSERAAAMADRLHAEPAVAQLLAWAVWGDALRTSADTAGAVRALQRAEQLLAQLPDASEFSHRSVAKLRLALCSDGIELAPACLPDEAAAR